MSPYPQPAEILLALLRARGIRTLREFEAGCIPLPACPRFITIGNAEVLTGVSLRLRIRMHALRNASEQELLDLWFDAVLPALADAGLAVRNVQRGEIQYDCKIDRLVCEVNVTLEGLLRKTGLQSGEEGADAASC